MYYIDYYVCILLHLISTTIFSIFIVERDVTYPIWGGATYVRFLFAFCSLIYQPLAERIGYNLLGGTHATTLSF